MSPAPWYSIRARAAAPRAAEVFVYGDIGESWSASSVLAAEFVREVAALDVDDLTVRINSYGGSVSDGLAIYNALRRHPATVRVSIEGVAASIASLIAMAGDTVEIAENAMLMIHAPWGAAMGNAAAMREYADMLDQWASAMASSYTSKTGRPHAEMLALLTDGADHWYTAAQAHDEGFVDQVVEALPVAAAAGLRARFPNFPAARSAHSTENTPMPTTTAPDAAARLDAERRDRIAETFGRFTSYEGVPTLLAQLQADPACTPEAAGQKLLAHLGAGEKPIAGRQIFTSDEDYFGGPQTRRSRAAQMAHELGQRGAGFDLTRLAAAALDLGGVRRSGMSDREVRVAAMTHTSSDFALLLESTARRELLRAYEAAPSGLRVIARERQAADFRVQGRVQLGSWPSLEEVHEAGEITSGTIAESAETYALKTYARKFTISRQAIVNDDLGAFADAVPAFGRSGAELIAQKLVETFTSGVMADGKALFHTDHDNLAGTAAKLDLASLGLAVAGMRSQKGLGSTAPLNLEPRYLVVPATLEMAARQLVATLYPVEVAKANPWASQLEVIVDARLDGVSATAWYLVAAPEVAPVLEYSLLESARGPQVEVEQGFDTFGLSLRCWIDFGCGLVDHRGAFKNLGAA